MRPLQRGDLVLNPDGNFGIVIEIVKDSTVVFLGNGLTQVGDRSEYRQLTLSDTTESPANFQELLDGVPDVKRKNV